MAVGGGVGLPLLRRAEPVESASATVADAEKARPTNGVVVSRTLRAAPSTIDLGGKTVDTWAYDQSLPGAPITVNAGDLLKVQVSNGLPDPTTIHWQGLALRNDMDGVPGLTMAEVPPGWRFGYSFVVPDPGTYWFHPHVGVQLETGRYAPLIVEDPARPPPPWRRPDEPDRAAARARGVGPDHRRAAAVDLTVRHPDMSAPAETRQPIGRRGARVTRR